MTLSQYINSLVKYDDELSTDEAGGNIRYIGKNPNNYVSIDGELWRIIGVMKNINDGNGNISDRVKLIRNESIGNFAWDTSDYSTNLYVVYLKDSVKIVNDLGSKDSPFELSAS